LVPASSPLNPGGFHSRAKAWERAAWPGAVMADPPGLSGSELTDVRRPYGAYSSANHKARKTAAVAPSSHVVAFPVDCRELMWAAWPGLNAATPRLEWK